MRTATNGRRTFFAMAFAVLATSASAQSVAPTYQGDPSTYKVIFEDQNFRVIAATWKKGATDKPHSHPIASVAYPLTDCTIRIHNPDGTTRDNASKSGVPFAAPITPSHTAENISANDCSAIFVERK
jgi:hypothetical protein